MGILKSIIKKHIFGTALCLGILVIALALLIRLDLMNKTGAVNIITSSTLTEAIDIAELSAAEFKYKGIADIYNEKDKNKTNAKPECRVCYSAVVKAYIDMKKVLLDVDSENKIVTATLPDIELKVSIDNNEEMKLLPSDADVELDSMLRYSKEDVENEAKQSEELLNTAHDNIQATIEGLLYPILRSQNYSLIWK